MVFITKRMGFAWAKHPSRACPSLEPDGYAFIQTNNPGWNKKSPHIFIPLPHHLTYLPKTIAISRRSSVGEAELRGDFVEPCLVHEEGKLVGAWVAPGIVGFLIPKVSL